METPRGNALETARRHGGAISIGGLRCVRRRSLSAFPIWAKTASSKSATPPSFPDAGPRQTFRSAARHLAGIVGAAVSAWMLAGGDASGRLAFYVPIRSLPLLPTPQGAFPFTWTACPLTQTYWSTVLAEARRHWSPRLYLARTPFPSNTPTRFQVTQTLDVPETGTSASIRLWQQRPGVLPLPSVYPGAVLTDARFLSDGQVVLIIGLPASPGGSNQTTLVHEVWRLDPSTAQLSHVALTGMDLRSPVVALAPDGEQLAYVTAGSFTFAPSNVSPRPDDSADAVWLVPLDGSRAPRRLWTVDAPVNQGFGVGAERIVDLVWTPDSTRLVAISRLGGTPTRTRLSLITVASQDESDAASPSSQLVLLPADITPNTAESDPLVSGWR